MLAIILDAAIEANGGYEKGDQEKINEAYDIRRILEEIFDDEPEELGEEFVDIVKANHKKALKMRPKKARITEIDFE